VTLLDLLKAKWTIYSLDAPTFAWLAAVGLLVFTGSVLARLIWLVRREERSHQQVTGKLLAIKVEHAIEPHAGLSQAVYEVIARAFEATPSLVPAWHRLQAQLVVRPDAAGAERIWTSESADEAFNEATVIEPSINRSFFAGIPGIVTGDGLLITFMAILVALLDVRIEENRVQGIENLIQGLSGKFVSSIAALAAATMYLLLEKPLFHRLGASRQRLVADRYLGATPVHHTPPGRCATRHDRALSEPATGQRRSPR